MPVTEQQAILLAELASSIRPYGARRWDKPGIVAAISKVKQLSLADVALAVIRAADDPTLETPGAIGNPRASCWRERNPDRISSSPASICGIHGTQYTGAGCPSCVADALAGDGTPARTTTPTREKPRTNWRELVKQQQETP